jgi:hypothetical protein
MRFLDGRLVTLRDRPWGHDRSVLVLGPLTGQDPERYRALMRDLLTSGTDHPLTRRLRRGRWVAVPEAAFEAHVRHVVTPLDRAALDDLDRLVADRLTQPLADCPLHLEIGEQFVVVTVAHAVGDGQVVNRLVADIVGAASSGARLPAWDKGVSFPYARALARLARTRRVILLRAAARMARHTTDRLARRDRPAVDEAPDAARVGATPWRPGTSAVSVVVRPESHEALRQWRRQPHVRASPTTTVFAAVVRGLRELGLDPSGDSKALCNLRLYLPPGTAVSGNFVGAAPLGDHPEDPAALDAVVRASIADGTPLIQSLLWVLTDWIHPWEPWDPATVKVTEHPDLVLTHLGRLREFADLPWRAGRERTAILVPTVSNPSSLTVVIHEFGGRLRLTAAFCTHSYDPDTVRRALGLVADDVTALLRGEQAASRRPVIDLGEGPLGAIGA